MSVEDKRIREFAYQIWESEGKPDGEDERHWKMARKLAEAEAVAPKAKPRKGASVKGKAAADVDKAPKASDKAASVAKSAALPGAESTVSGKAPAAKSSAAKSSASKPAPAKAPAAKKPRAAKKPSAG
ncbi:DUF2934 domain-containing protein [Pseudomonas sp. UBA6562]|uniref:DUF2934 domain-containing protein n=1 Tax=Pseudomonas sp. UBA6562 TaxID=1947332 RepID=UPI0025DECA88|nr:DUF2934 domain-containing protein [Pseudomonas sp. UBA6562]